MIKEINNIALRIEEIAFAILAVLASGRILDSLLYCVQKGDYYYLNMSRNSYVLFISIVVVFGIDKFINIYKH